MGRAMHQAGYDALGLAYLYVPFACEDLAAAVAGARAMAIRGLGISMPFKTEILPLLDAIDPRAQRLGAVNTVVNDGGRLVGHNTDADGALAALSEHGGARGRRVLLVGAGGAARAIAFALVDEGAHLTIVNRTDERGAALAREVSAAHRPFADPGRDHDVFLNASSAGMTDVTAASPLDPALLDAGKIAMDAVYKPVDTQFLRAARARGAVTIDGSRMLLFQAMGQFTLYTGRAAPREAMEAALSAALALDSPAR